AAESTQYSSYLLRFFHFALAITLFPSNHFFFLNLTRPPRSPLFPYTTLFRSGQYLRPTVNHLPVRRFVRPEEFDRYRERSLAIGFLECVSGPLVRSSYRAERALQRNNAGLDNRRLAT